MRIPLIRIMYEFEYDKEGYLFRYFEREKDNVKLYCFATGCTVIKYQDNGEHKSLFEYYSPIKILHRFEAGESWLTTIRDIEEKKEEEEEKEEEQVDEFEDIIERRFADYYRPKRTAIENQLEEIKFSIKTNPLYPTEKKRIVIENDVPRNFTINHNNIKDWKGLI